MNGFHISASGEIQGHHDPLVFLRSHWSYEVFKFKHLFNKQPRFLAPLAIGQRVYVVVCCPSARLCFNFFFKHLLL